MAKDSKSKRHLRRLKRENSLLWRQVEQQQNQLQAMVQVAMQLQGEMQYRAELGNSPEEAL